MTINVTLDAIAAFAKYDHKAVNLSAIGNTGADMLYNCLTTVRRRPVR